VVNGRRLQEEEEVEVPERWLEAGAR